MRMFFGGMAMYHNGEGMARLLGVPNAHLFASDFVHGVHGKVDPLMLPSRLPQMRGGSGDTEFCISLRIWDLLLWFAIMKRPRRDVGIMPEFAKTFAQYSMQLLPRSIFPFETVPMTRVDAVDRMQVFYSPICLFYCTFMMLGVYTLKHGMNTDLHGIDV